MLSRRASLSASAGLSRSYVFGYLYSSTALVHFYESFSNIRLFRPFATELI